ncbi:hypothetical protein ACJX0J_019284 [Zea mays]
MTRRVFGDILQDHMMLKDYLSWVPILRISCILYILQKKYVCVYHHHPSIKIKVATNGTLRRLEFQNNLSIEKYINQLHVKLVCHIIHKYNQYAQQKEQIKALTTSHIVKLRQFNYLSVTFHSMDWSPLAIIIIIMNPRSLAAGTDLKNIQWKEEYIHLPTLSILHNKKKFVFLKNIVGLRKNATEIVLALFG